MNKYKIARAVLEPEKVFAIDLEFSIESGDSDLYFPFWRPGRYEPGNFVKWSRNFKVQGNTAPIQIEKIAPNHWVITSNVRQVITVNYEWCIHELNAGSSYLSDSLFYFNPVNLFCFIKQSELEPILLHVVLDADWQYAGGLAIQDSDAKGNYFFEARNFDELADSPLVFSSSIQSIQWKCDNTTIHCHSVGELPLKWRMGDYSHIRQFTDFQIQRMETLPVNEYHYLYIFTPNRMRHGVEHCNSTMIVMGQGEVSDDVYYDEVLSISSHELFHTWNVKYCRPKDLLPYDFTKAQFSATGFITEGVTTYYGELMLWQSGIWPWEKMMHCILEWLNNHLNNAGRFSSSLLDSSIDTWVDGYVQGTPGRKVSIYNEGALMAFLTDVFIIQSTDGKRSLNDVMLFLVSKYNTHTIGYNVQDYWDEVERIAGRVPSSLITLVSHPKDYTTEVLAALEWLDQKCRLNTTEEGRIEVIPEALKEINKLSQRYRC